MARKKISEFAAKTLLNKSLDLPYAGMSYNSQAGEFLKYAKSLDSSKKYVVKVDQGVKKRFKSGLIVLNVEIQDLGFKIQELESKGYTNFLIEPFVEYDKANEKYLAIERLRDGLKIYFSDKGGVDIEENAETIKRVVIPAKAGIQNFMDPRVKPEDDSLREIVRALGLDNQTLEKIIQAFNDYYFSFLEINPLVVASGEVKIIDLAVEVDSAAEFFVDDAWTSKDYVEFRKSEKTTEEKAVEDLADKSQAAFSYTMLNPNGSIWMLLSGGGASIVLADEVANLGLGKELANYGEYSGNPNAEETYIYTKNVISLMLKSQPKADQPLAESATKKVLIIGGGVANFTDIRITFRGVIQALEEVRNQLNEQGIKVYVRRGGPKQAEGLAQMREFLEKNKLYGMVSGPDMVLTDIVEKAMNQIKDS